MFRVQEAANQAAAVTSLKTEAYIATDVRTAMNAQTAVSVSAISTVRCLGTDVLGQNTV